MITGTITDHRAYVTLLIKGEGIQANAEFLVDTGYTGTLTLPLADCIALKLPYVGERESFLANGSKVDTEMYDLTVIWDGKEREIQILAIGQERLLGTIMLNGYKLCADFGSNTLTIEQSA